MTPTAKPKVKWSEEAQRWYCQVSLGTNKLTGKRNRKYRSWPGSLTEREAQAACDEWAESLAPQSGLSIGQTVNDVLGEYIAQLSLKNRAPSTLKTYRSLKRCYIDRLIGEIDVDDVKPYVVEGAYAALMMQGGKGGDGVSARTLLKLHWLLSGMFKWAVRMGVTPNNPMPSVDKPMFTRHEATAFDDRQMAAIAERLKRGMGSSGSGARAVFARNVAMAAYLALYTGARCGECLALTRAKSTMRRDLSVRIDSTLEDDGGLRIRPCTKGHKGRTVAVTEDDMRVMAAHTAWQDGSYIDRPGAALTLCCDRHGGLMRPSSVSKAFGRMLKDLGLPRGTSFHTLRHTHATWLIYNGTDIKTVQERLGHASITTTLELYSHVLPGRDSEAAASFARVMREPS